MGESNEPEKLTQDRSQRLWHYCSLSTFMQIVSGRSIWLSELRHLNDDQEGTFVWSVLSNGLEERGVEARDILAVKEAFDHALAMNSPLGFCMSEEEDLLSQWRAYGDDGYGVALGISIGALDFIIGDQYFQKGLSIQRVKYGSAGALPDLTHVLDNVCLSIIDGANSFPDLMIGGDKKKHLKAREQMLGALAPFIFTSHTYKHQAFSEEREWRLIRHAVNKKLVSPELTAISMAEVCDYRVTRSRLIPFWSMRLPELTKISVMLGPRNVSTPFEVQNFIERSKLRLSDEVRRSHAPYR